MTIRHAALVALLAMTCSQGAHASSTRELIDSLVEASRKSSYSWVQPSDCPDEQNALRQWRHPKDGTTCGEGSDESIAEALEYPWVYRYSGVRQGEEKTAEELQRESEQRYERSRELERKMQAELAVTGLGSIGLRREYIECDIRLARLVACALSTAARNKSRTAPVSPAAAQAKLSEQCAPEALAEANGELQKIDRRLAAFLESPAGQQTGTSTPSLQAVMWGTSEEAQVMKRYCPDADAFIEQIDARMASFKAAEKACRQVQSRPEICGPVAPEALMQQ